MRSFVVARGQDDAWLGAVPLRDVIGVSAEPDGFAEHRRRFNPQILRLKITPLSSSLHEPRVLVVLLTHDVETVSRVVRRQQFGHVEREVQTLRMWHGANKTEGMRIRCVPRRRKSLEVEGVADDHGPIHRHSEEQLRPPHADG